MKRATFETRVAEIVARVEGPEVRCWEDAPDKRIKIQFRVQPDQATCKYMRAQGFRFVGGASQYWVRQLTQTSRTAAASVMQTLTEANLRGVSEMPENG